MYWPRMSSDLESFIKECQTCQEFSQYQQKETFVSSEIPELPWQYLAADLFELRQMVLRSMHMSLRNLHTLMDLNMSPVFLVIHSPAGKPKME